ncbi:MAG: hypothetical protein FWE76_08395 [Symbiobacteriaceae bacterium]|nr:hypothetical protein [Symbiobacteriaceae bacterium]
MSETVMASHDDLKQAYRNFRNCEQAGTSIEQMPSGELVKYTDAWEIKNAYFGVLIYSFLQEWYPDFLCYLQLNDQVTDFIFPLTLLMTEHAERTMDFKLSGYPSSFRATDMTTREEAEAALQLKESIESMIIKGVSPDPELYRKYLALGLQNTDSHVQDPGQRSALEHSIYNAVERKVLEDMLFSIFPVPTGYDDVPF